MFLIRTCKKKTVCPVLWGDALKKKKRLEITESHFSGGSANQNFIAFFPPYLPPSLAFLIPVNEFLFVCFFGNHTSPKTQPAQTPEG